MDLPTSTRQTSVWGWAAMIAAFIVAFVLVYPLFVAERAEEPESLETTGSVVDQGALEDGDELTGARRHETAQR